MRVHHVPPWAWSLRLCRGAGGTTRALPNFAWGALLLAGGSGSGADNEDNAHVWRAATALLALLLLLAGGGSDSPSLPSEAWLWLVANDGTTMLRRAIKEFFPPVARGPGGSRNGGSRGGDGGARTEDAAAGDNHPNPRGEHATWVVFARDAPSTGEDGVGGATDVAL
jgi:hypothetical protein